MLKTGDKVGIVCCSNGLKKEYGPKIQLLEQTLCDMGLVPVFSDYIYVRTDEKSGVYSGTARERAQALMNFYKDDEIKEIFDISGGDLANGVLPYLDYEIIAAGSKKFWGYSDLTTIINAIYAKTKKESVLYQIKNMIYDYKETQVSNFQKSVMKGTNDLYDLNYEFIQGHEMKGVVIGGNIRCLLKLAGTEYMPDLTDKILLLEGYSGTVAKMETYLCQLQQLGAFEKVSGILLGTFTQMEAECVTSSVPEMIVQMVGEKVPIAVTREIGHGSDSKGIIIGREIRL